jgi:MOSC N-terminal beta barrel domain
MESSYKASPLILPVTGITVLATILATSQYSPIARPIQTVCSRIYLSILLFTKAFYKNKASIADNETVVTSLYKYPVKSLRTIPCDEVVFDTKGVAGDRRYMLVSPAPLPLYGQFLPDDPTHRFVTQRQCPILARVVVIVQTTSDGKNELHFSSEVLPNETCTISMEANPSAPIYKSTLWGDVVTVQDMGDDIAKYLKKIIALDETVPDESKKDIRLAIQYVKDTRTANDKFVPPVARSLSGQNPSVHLGDGFPLYVKAFFPFLLSCFVMQLHEADLIFFLLCVVLTLFM